MRLTPVKTCLHILFALVTLIGVASQSACSSFAGNDTPPPVEAPASTPTDVFTSAATANTPIESGPTATEPTRTLRFDEGLNASGPWLVIRTSMGLFAFNQDGSGTTTLVGRPDIAAPLDLR